MTLTKQEAIEGHRKMWSWIADQLEKASPIDNFDIYDLKERYCADNNLNLKCNCFCCEFADRDCDSCPLVWGTESETFDYFCEEGMKIPIRYRYMFESDIENTTGLWNYADTLSDYGLYEEAAKIARQIADLPEKDEIEISREE